MNHYYTKIITGLCFILIATAAKSQSIIRGKVVDSASRQPLENVSVINKTSPDAKTITDENGNFSISVQSAPATLILSYIGYKSAAVKLDSVYNLIAMRSAPVNLEDVVIFQK